MTWDRRLYFPSEGRRAEDFFALKNPTALAGFEPAKLGTKGQHATPRPPKPLTVWVKGSFLLLCPTYTAHQQLAARSKTLLEKLILYWLS
jgi:hypothetical protein